MTNDEFVEKIYTDHDFYKHVNDADFDNALETLRRSHRALEKGLDLFFYRCKCTLKGRRVECEARERKETSLTAAEALSLANKAEQGVVQKTIDDILAEIRMYATMGVTEYATFFTCDAVPVVRRLLELGYEASVTWVKDDTKKLEISWKAGGKR